MKKYYKILPFCLLTLLTLSTCNKNEISSMQEESFIKFFGGSGEDLAAGLLQMDDGGYVIIGTIQTTDKGSDIYLLRTDKYGNEIWPAKTFGGNLDDMGFDIKEDSDGGIVLLGTLSDTTSEGVLDRNALLVKLDVNGNELWSQTVGTENDEESSNLLINSLGEYIVSGYCYEGSDKDYWYTILNQNREVIYQASFGSASVNEEISSIQELASGQYIALGQLSTVSGTDISAVVIDVSGVFTSHETYQRPSTDLPGGTIQTGNELISVSTGIDINTNNSIILLLSLTVENYQAIFNPIKEIALSGVDLSGASLCSLADGGYCIVGTQEIAGNEDIYLQITDSQGNEVPPITFGGTGSQKGIMVQQTADGGFVILGTNSFDRNTMITLIKTKPDGSL